MDIDLYQKIAGSTANTDLSRETRMAVAALGLAGEAGEVAELYKKFLGHGHTLPLEDLIKELGDVLWYVAENCTLAGVDMSTVLQANVTKLRKRYPDGFTHERSRNRDD